MKASSHMCHGRLTETKSGPKCGGAGAPRVRAPAVPKAHHIAVPLSFVGFSSRRLFASRRVAPRNNRSATAGGAGRRQRLPLYPRQRRTLHAHTAHDVAGRLTLEAVPAHSLPSGPVGRTGSNEETRRDATKKTNTPATTTGQR